MSKEENVVDKDFEDLQTSDNFLGKAIIGFAIVFLIGLSILVSIKVKDPLKELNESNLVTIDTEKFYELYKSSEKFVLLLGRPDCSHCIAFRPVITKFANDNNIKVYYLDAYSIETEEDWNFIWAKINQEGTPSLGVFENQELVDSVSGEMTKEELTEWFSKVGVI
ncbi:MAG: thioredoxin family protein [Bacilli bacterium]|nr:thioredoxin family protein [Bacilli bacterium]